MSSNLYTIFDIANWFLQKDTLDHKKLQKLCYYAQAWSLALRGAPLMDEKFEGWAHGPVNRTLWNQLKEFGFLNIPTHQFKKRAREISSCDQEFLERVWATYGELSGFQLENLTHLEEPWKKSRTGLLPHQPGSCHISNNDMQVFYSNLIYGEGIGE